MKIKTNDLKTVLNELKNGLADDTFDIYAANFYFIDGKILIFNNNLCVVYPYLDIDMECSVRADQLLKTVSSFNDEEIELSLKDNTIHISGNTRKANLLASRDIDIGTLIDGLNLPDSESDKWKSLPENFMDGIRLCSFSISSNKEAPNLNSLHVIDNEILTADRERISVFSLNEVMDPFSIPKVAIDYLIRFNIDKYVILGSWVCFTNNDGIVFAIKTIDRDEFKNDPRDFFDFKRRPSIKLPSKLKEVVKATSIFNGQDGGPEITLEFNNDKVICSSKNDNGWISDEVDIEYPKDPIKFTTNSVFFLQIFDKIKSMAISLDLTKALFTTDDFRHLLILYVDEEN